MRHRLKNPEKWAEECSVLMVGEACSGGHGEVARRPRENCASVNASGKHDFGRAVSRILSSPLRAERIICLSGHTRNPANFFALERAAPRFPIWLCTRWGFPCRFACAQRGGLLHHLFTLTDGTLPRRGSTGGIFSVALSVKTFLRSARVYLANAELEMRSAVVSGPLVPSSALEVTRHRALRCSDFPPPACAESDSPLSQNQVERIFSFAVCKGRRLAQSATAMSISRV